MPEFAQKHRRAPRLPRLENARDVKCEMAAVYREMRRGRLDGQHGARLINALSLLGKLIEVSEVEAALEKLEERQAQERGRRAWT